MITGPTSNRDRSLRPFLAGLAALLLLAPALISSALAGEVIKLRNGDLVPGEVVSLDDQAVVFDREAGGRAKIAWTEILPLSRYELWESTLAADDADGRVELAGWALEQGLFVYARKELLKAKGLGVDDLPALEKLLIGVAKAEANATMDEVDRLLETGDPEAALVRVRRYLRVAPPGADADRVRGRVPDILVRIEQREAVEAEAEQSDADRRKAEKRQKWIDDKVADALADKQKAAETSIEAFAYLAKGNQTRARRALTKSEKGFIACRTTLMKVKRVVQPGETRELCVREMDDCDRRMLDLLTRWGRLEVGNKSWKRASAVVDRGLRIDAVHTELLDLRREIDENWLRRRLSDITNAEGRESGQ